MGNLQKQNKKKTPIQTNTKKQKTNKPVKNHKTEIPVKLPWAKHKNTEKDFV